MDAENFLKVLYMNDLISDWHETLGRYEAASPVDWVTVAECRTQLGHAYCGRFNHFGSAVDLDKAIEWYGQALQLTPVGDINRPGTLTNHAKELLTRYEMFGSTTDLALAITELQEAVDDAPHGQQVYESAQANLATGLLDRFKYCGSINDINRATTLAEAVLHVTPPGHPRRTLRLVALAAMLVYRFKATSSPQDIDNAIKLYQDAVDSIPIPMAGTLSISLNVHPSQALDQPDVRRDYLSNMGDALLERFSHKMSKEQFRSRSEAEEDSTLSALINNLPIGDLSLTNGGIYNDLLLSIDAHREAVENVPPKNPKRTKWLNNYANALQSLYYHSKGNDRLEILNSLISVRTEVVKSTPSTHPHFASRQSNLGSDLQSKFEETGLLDVSKLAIECFQKAIDATTEDQPECALWLYHLGLAFERRFEQTTSLDDFNQAVEIMMKAAKVASGAPSLRIEAALRSACILPLKLYLQGTTSNPWTSPSTRSAGKDADQKTSFSLRKSKADPLILSNRERQPPKIDALSRPISDSIHVATFPLMKGPPRRRFGSRKRDEQEEIKMEINRRAALLRVATELLRSASPRVLSLHEQEDKVVQFSDIPRLAAAYSILTGDSPYQTVQLLETGRGIILGLQLDTRTDVTVLEEKYPEYANTFKRLRDVLDLQGGEVAVQKKGYLPVDPNITVFHGAALEFDALLQKIRSLTGFDRFLLGQSEQELKAMASHGPIVMFNVSLMSSNVLIVTKDDVSCLSLPKLKAEDAEKNSQKFLKLLDKFSIVQSRQANKDLMIVLEWLWDVAVEPVLTKLGITRTPENDDSWPRIWWVPSEWLNVLPIHAAGYYKENSNRNAIDRVVSSYIPTIKSLSYARERSQYLRSSTQKDQEALFVSMSQTEGQSPLPGALSEIETIERLVPQSVIRHHLPLPTKSEFKSMVQSSSIVHLACHGQFNARDPLRSQLLLRDHEVDPLTVEDIMRMKLTKSKFAYLSACHTASSRMQDMFDEGTHLAGAFHLAGFPHVIGTLWWIEDESSVAFVKDVYNGMLEGSDINFELSARALHQAVRKVIRQRPICWAAFIHVGA